MVNSLQDSINSATTPANPDLDCDLAIVGAGIAGATLACALRDSGLKVTLIESQPQEVAVTRKLAYALTLLTGKILNGVGVWQEIQPKITTFEQIQISDVNQHIVKFRPEDLGTEALGYIGEHSVILPVLQNTLNQSPNITWVCPAEVLNVRYLPDWAEIEVKTADTPSQILKTRLVVAADGSKSPLRQAAGISTRGWKYWQSCVAFTIKAEKPHQNIAYERFWYTGPMGVLPLPENRFQVVWTAPHAEAQALQALDEQEFLKILEERTAGLLGRLELIGTRFVYPVQLMHSNHYVQPRLALIGDAIHCCHPVGGQGLNMGIRDAAALAEVLQTAVQQGEDIGHLGVLKRYEQWRKKENWAILGFTDFLDRTFSTTWPPVIAIRRLGLWMLRSVPVFRHFVLRLMTGLLGHSPQLAK